MNRTLNTRTITQTRAKEKKTAHTEKNNIAHMNTDTNPRCACTNVPFPAYFYALAWGSRAMCATISVKIDGIQLSSSVSFSVLTIYTLHFWASVKKRRTHTHTQCPCRNCAIKRSEVSAHIFNTLMHWRIHSITQIINSHLKRFFHDLSLSLALFHLSLTVTNGHNIFQLIVFNVYECVHVIVSFIQSALWYFITTAQYRRRYDFFLALSLSLRWTHGRNETKSFTSRHSSHLSFGSVIKPITIQYIHSYSEIYSVSFERYYYFFSAWFFFMAWHIGPFDWKYIALFRFCQFYHTNLYICWFFLVPCIICGHNSNIHRFLRLMLWYSVFVFFFLHRIFSFGSHFLRA